MASISHCPIPQNAFLQKYAARPGYADCYVTEVAGSVSQAAFVEAFYTTPLFKVERGILAAFARRPSTDRDARQLAKGIAPHFAAWRVEKQTAEQLLLADFTGKTRSWLMAVPLDAAEGAGSTRLYFGSAVVARVDKTSGQASMGLVFRALLGFHKLYSRALLRAARVRVLRGR
ncbi:MAG: hypothetical protein ACRCV9_02715 [Burkholderiaceae bacterium]